jgi:sulfoxide reductase heme-binding subunit YedZ
VNELLWFTSRATGVVSILLLTAVLVLGLLVAGRRRPHGMSQTVVTGLHRSLALGTSAFLLLHVATAVIETYVSIDLVSVVVPFSSSYQRAWVGLGTIALDIGAAVVVTSLLRHRLPERLWRGVHLLALVLWPLAIAHGLALGTADEPVLRLTTIACAVVGAASLAWRGLATHHDELRRSEVALQEWT